MKKRTVILLASLVLSASVFAVEAPVAGPFFRTYVQSLCAAKEGDLEKARSLMEAYTAHRNHRVAHAARLAHKGDFVDASVAAAWIIVDGHSTTGFSISRDERSEAMAMLKNTFGGEAFRKPRNDQQPVDMAASTLGWFLSQGDVRRAHAARGAIHHGRR